MKRNLLILVAIAVGAIALAQGTTRVVGAEGRGIAGNADGHHGRFHLGVRKLMRGSEVRMEGRFEWNEIVPNSNHGFTLVMARPLQIGVNESHDVCEFSGPARLSRMGPNGPIHIEGRLNVRVADNRRPNTGGSTGGGGDQSDGANLPDLIQWQFIAASNTGGAAFNGAVREGDIKVFARVVGGSTTSGGGGGTSGGGRGGL